MTEPGSHQQQPAQASPTTAANSNTAQTAILVPWYLRPWLWTAVFLILIAAVLSLLFWRQWSAAQGERAFQAALLEGLERRNAFLRGERDRALALLREDPCAIRDGMGAIAIPGVPGTTPALPAAPQGAQDGATAPQPAPGAQADPKPALPGATAPAGGGDAVAVAALARQATVFIVCPVPEGAATGTGFFVTPRHVMTNAHVVDGAKALFLTSELLVAEAGKSGGFPRARILRVEGGEIGGRDFAVLELDRAVGVRPLAIQPQVAQAEEIHAIGYPGFIGEVDPKYHRLLEEGDLRTPPEVIYTTGHVNAFMKYDLRAILHSATISQGNSGGPLLNARGEVVGINTFIRMDDQSNRQANYALDAAGILDFLRASGVTPTVAPAPGGAAR